MAKGTRITLTKSESESATGKALIDMILSICHDGEIEIREVEDLHLFLRRDTSTIAAVPFLRAITREIISDGTIDQTEAYRLKTAFERVMPKEVRGVVSTHLNGIGLPRVTPEDEAPPWTRHAATHRQLEYICHLGGDITAGMTKGEASVLIDRLLSRRPPTPRQTMLLRFFDRMDLLGATKEEVSEWVDELFAADENMERAWQRFKLATRHDPFECDATVVPVGAFLRYRVPQRRQVRSRHGLFAALVSFLRRQS